MSLAKELWEEVIDLVQEDDVHMDKDAFSSYVADYLPPDVLDELSILFGGDNDFIGDVWEEKFAPIIDCDLIPQGECEVCERRVKRMTRHHVYPRETHKTMAKRGLSNCELQTTIRVW